MRTSRKLLNSGQKEILSETFSKDKRPKLSREGKQKILQSMMLSTPSTKN